MKRILSLFIIVFCLFSCSGKKSEKRQHSRNNIVNVHNRVKKIKTDTLLIGYPFLYLINKYLLISDYKSTDKIIYIFNKNNFEYIKSVGQQGPGPNEITELGFIGTDEINKKFYVTDNGKLKIYGFDLDSALEYSNYLPTVKMKMNKKALPMEYIYFNDTLALSLMMKPTGNSGYNEEVVRLNFKTWKMVPMKYTYPGMKKKRISFTASKRYGLNVECCWHNDLMTITDLYGNLKYNVYGPNWKEKNNYHNYFQYYWGVVFVGDKIVAGYADGRYRYSGKKGYFLPTKFLVFDKDGDYIKTLETGYGISEFVYDKDNNRIIMNVNDAYMQFAYLNLDGLL